MIGKHTRAALFDRVWSEPVDELAKEWALSGRVLAKPCRHLKIPVPSQNLIRPDLLAISIGCGSSFEKGQVVYLTTYRCLDVSCRCAELAAGRHVSLRRFGERVKAMGITEVIIAPRSPWQNAYVERAIGSIRRECLDHVIVFNERHLSTALKAGLRRVLLHGACPEPVKGSITITAPGCICLSQRTARSRARSSRRTAAK